MQRLINSGQNADVRQTEGHHLSISWDCHAIQPIIDIVNNIFPLSLYCTEIRACSALNKQFCCQPHYFKNITSMMSKSTVTKKKTNKLPIINFYLNSDIDIHV